MPSPVAHSLVAIALHRRLPLRRRCGARLSLLAALLIAANLPDADVLPGLLVGDANRYHHQVTHSLAFCGVAVAVLAMGMNKFWPLGVKNWFAVNGMLVGSHLALDALTMDTAAPFGQPLLWPLWQGYVHSPLTVFLDVRRTGASAEFFASLLSSHNLKAVAWEVTLLCPLVILAGLIRKERGGKSK